MPVKKRVVKAGGASASSAASGGSNIKKRTLPKQDILTKEGSELSDLIGKIKASGDYGDSFYMASNNRFQAPRLLTGVLGIDLPLGGGWTMGRAGMLYGERSSGKSTTSLIAIAALHRQHDQAVAAYVDLEGTFDRAWARKLGVDLDRLVIIEPEGGEHAVDLTDAILRVKEVSMCVTDSIAMLVPMKEVEASSSQEFMGLQARLIGKFVRRVNQAMVYERKRDHYVSLIHLNQFRMKVGLVFGDPRTLPGGKALEYSTSQQIEVKNKEHMGKDEQKEEVVFYNEHSLKITKNKTGGPLKESLFRLVRTPHDGMSEGWVDQAKAFHSTGTKIGLVDGPAQAFTVEGIKHKFRGAKDFNAWAQENQEVYFDACGKIVDGYRNKWGLEG